MYLWANKHKSLIIIQNWLWHMVWKVKDVINGENKVICQKNSMVPVHVKFLLKLFIKFSNFFHVILLLLVGNFNGAGWYLLFSLLLYFLPASLGSERVLLCVLLTLMKTFHTFEKFSSKKISSDNFFTFAQLCQFLMVHSF